MTENKCGSLILDAIDQLRKRKARPDLDRICHMLERRHGLKGTIVNEELTQLVNAGSVIKVDYKGNTSYRNAAKWVKTKTQYHGGFFSTSDVSSAVLEAVRVLTVPTADHPQLRSASVQDIDQCLQKRDVPFHLTSLTLRAILDKEVTKGNLLQLPNGEYVRLKCSSSNTDSPEKSEVARKSESGLSSKVHVDNVVVQTLTKTAEAHSGIIKSCRKSKSFGDSSSVGSSNSSIDETSVSRCDYCLFTASANRKGEAEELLVCRDCGAKAHPSCMEYTKLLYESFPQPQNWQCPDCKTCVVCEETGNSEDLVTCYICLKGYHLTCHEPVVNNKPSGVWICSDCDSSDHSKDTDKKSIKKLKAWHSDEEYEPPSAVYKDEFFKSIERYPSSVPLAKKWSIENVVAFLKYLGFKDEAPAFREQEIDGMSLLLLKRNDVLTGLGIKLGPALKIYKHIMKLQSRVADN